MKTKRRPIDEASEVHLDMMIDADAGSATGSRKRTMKPQAVLVRMDRGSVRGPGKIATAMLFALQAVSAPAQAQTPAATAQAPVQPGPSQPDWGNDIVVTARDIGPALWRVRKGDATVIILGTIAPLPRDFTWTDWRVKRAIRQSREMLVSSEPEANLVWMNAWNDDGARRLRQPKNRTIEDDLSPADRQRFAAAILSAGQAEPRYSTLRPAIAAMLLNADWREHSQLSNTALSSRLAAYGRKSRTAVRFVQQISLLPTLDEVPNMAPAPQMACFHALLESQENERARARVQAQAWAEGNIALLREAYIAPANCAAVIPADARKRQAATQQWTLHLLRALNRPATQTLAMIDIGSLLRPDGVLAQLRAAGATVDVPQDHVPPAPGRDAD